MILRALQQSQIDKAAAAAKSHEAAARAAQVAVERVFEHCLQVRLEIATCRTLLSSSHEHAQLMCWPLCPVPTMSQMLHSLMKLLGGACLAHSGELRSHSCW